MTRPDPQNASMALFCDFENVALGVREARYEQFEIGLILERLLLKGSIVLKKAYCDWERYKDFKAAMHQASFELIEIPHVRISGKNSADIRMVVDALDLCYTKTHVDCFVIISGDSDFSPLVSKLRENNKTVIGVGVKNSTSDLLIKNCDEFIFYDDLVRVPKARGTPRPRAAAKPAKAPDARPPAGAQPPRGKALAQDPSPEDTSVARPLAAPLPPPVAAPVTAPAPADNEAAVSDDRLQHGLDQLVETVEALVAERGENERIWGSLVKQTLKRRNPGFNEVYYGFRTFNRMLEEARDRRLIELEDDDRSGGYIVRAL